jgi:hypothetical protein
MTETEWLTYSGMAATSGIVAFRKAKGGLYLNQEWLGQAKSCGLRRVISDYIEDEDAYRVITFLTV